MLDHGARVLHAMGGQRERLKGAQRRVLDVLNAAGMSEALLRRADRRQRGDALLVYAGMLLVLLLLGLLLWATKGWRSR